MSHTCSTCIVRCIDFRLGEALHDYHRHEELYGDADVISVAGACKGLNDDQSGFLDNQIGLSKKLHDIKNIVLINHTDCGAYGGRTAFSSAEVEREHHLTELKKAQAYLAQKYPDVNVKIMLADQRFVVGSI
jgi:carbonic anhydrase